MYDIKIFLEKNWEFWARANLGKEKVYALWKNYIELLQGLKEWIELSNQSRWNISKKVSRFSNFLQTDSKEYAFKI